jgi:pimeloyl-ACP methyl ester carboxylesterase
MRLKRMFVDVGGRRVHLRVMGDGPPVLLVHQSPRSSAEWLPLMRRMGDRFTLVAPDTPGFGESAPLPQTAPDVADYARALLDLLNAMGIAHIAAYGFHSGAIILMTALKLAPERFLAVACGGYALWTEAERADFGRRYTPAFHPSPYGEHLAWAWNRILEQSWFFPWYRTEPDARLPGAHADVARVNEIVMEILAAGNSFSAGYAAVLEAKRDLPPADAAMPPVLIAAYDGDPLQAHIDRLPALPPGWEARKVATPAALEDAAMAWLQPHAGPTPLPAFPEARDAGFVRVAAGGFEGLLHWRGLGGRLWFPAPGSAAGLAPPGVLALDPPGHGLSDPWDEAPDRLEDWAEVLAAAARAIGAGEGIEAVEGESWSALLAESVARRLGVAHVATPLPRGDRARWRAEGLPDTRPDRFGAHLHRAWGAVRAASLFEPWFQPSAATARAFAAHELAPETLARRHLAMLRASGARSLLRACLDAAAQGDKN